MAKNQLCLMWVTVSAGCCQCTSDSERRDPISKCAESTVNPLPFPWPGVLQVTVTSETKQMTNCKALGEPDYV